MNFKYSFIFLLLFASCKEPDFFTSIVLDVDKNQLHVQGLMLKDTVAALFISEIYVTNRDNLYQDELRERLTGLQVYVKQAQSSAILDTLVLTTSEPSFPLGFLDRNSNSEFPYFVSSKNYPLPDILKYEVEILDGEKSISAQFSYPEETVITDIHWEQDAGISDVEQGCFYCPLYTHNASFKIELTRSEEQYFLIFPFINSFRPMSSGAFFSSNLPIQQDYVIYREETGLQEYQEFPYQKLAFKKSDIPNNDGVLELRFLAGYGNNGRDFLIDGIIIAELTREAFEFERTKSLQTNTRELPFNDIVPIFSNINNGSGIVAGWNILEVIQITDNEL